MIQYLISTIWLLFLPHRKILFRRIQLLPEPLQFQLSNIELKGAEFIYDNRTINNTTKLNDLSFYIPYIGWDQKEKSEAGLRFAFKNEGYFESSINIDPVGGDFEAKITVYHLYLDAFQNYVATSANVNSVEGMLNSNFAIAGNMNEPDKSIVIGFNGSARLFNER